MYPPPHHQEYDQYKMIELIKQFPLGILISAHENIPYASHIPIIYNEHTGRLVAHIDAENPQVNTLNEGSLVTVIFKGPDTYISPSVYSTKQLPTWNYLIVHVTGTIIPVENSDLKKESLVEMTAFLEGQDANFKLEMDDPRMDRLLPYIKAFEIDIKEWEGKFKLSQDKNPEDLELAKVALKEKTKRSMDEFIDRMYGMEP